MDTIDRLETELKDALARLRTLRDESRVDLHLARMDLRDGWARLRTRLPNLQRLTDDLKQALEELRRETHEATQP